MLIIAGSEQMTGAALLCAYAALKTGCGLVTIANDNPSFIYPELMFIPTENIVEFISENKIKRIGIGPGLGVNTNTEILVKNIFTNAKLPLVIDADALNIIAKIKHFFHPFLPTVFSLRIRVNLKDYSEQQKIVLTD